MTTIETLDARYYQGFAGADALLDAAVCRYLKPGQNLLDAGAGRGNAFPHDYHDWAHVVGVDLDEGILENPSLHEARVADLAQMPFEDGSFDVILTRCVLEHLPEPISVFREMRRVAKPGGHLIFRTPNRFHYFAIVAKLTPQQFHTWFNKKRGFEEDVFDTFYRANDRRTLSRLAQSSGFRVVELELLEIKPGYLSFHPMAYRLGIGYERLVRRFGSLQDLRSNIIGVLQAT